MNPTPHTASINPGDAPRRARSGFSRPAALIGGATALVALTAVATTLALRPSPMAAADAGTVAVAAQALPGTASAQRATGTVPDDGAADKPASAKPAPAAGERPAEGRTAAPRTDTAKPPAPARTAAACATCGVVEAVTPVQKKGEGTGVGAVGGAVVGGLIGSQMGGGDGKKAMAVLGAVGGGMAGHEIEKRQRATTLYQVKVRMEDGTHRTVTQATAPAVGQKVTVEGSQLKPRVS
jgi:outer membrane lipoprotein SlyB